MFYINIYMILKTLSSFEFFRTLNAVLNGLLKATLEDGFKTRIFFLFPLCTCAVFVWAKCAQKLRVLHWRNDTSVAPPLHKVHFRQVYSWCTKLQNVSITSHSPLRQFVD